MVLAIAPVRVFVMDLLLEDGTFESARANCDDSRDGSFDGSEIFEFSCHGFCNGACNKLPVEIPEMD